MDHKEKDRPSPNKMMVDLLKRHKSQLYIPLLLDLGFFFTLGMVVGALGERLLEFLYALGAVVISSSSSAIQAQDIYAALPEQAHTLGWQGALLLAAMLAAVYALYVCFQGMIWAVLCSWVKALDKSDYVKKFAKINLFWGFCALLLLLWAIWIELMSRIGELQSEIPWWILLMVVIYLSSTSYALLATHSAWKSLGNTFRHALHPRLIAGGIVLFILAYGLEALMSVLGSSSASLVLGAIVVFGFALCARLFWYVFVEVHYA